MITAAPITCIECGEQIEYVYVKEVNDEMAFNAMCHTDNYWRKQLADRDRAFVTPNYEHYRIGEEGVAKVLRGYYGSKFEVHYLNGEVVTTDNLWHQGRIPEHWQGRFTVTATVQG